MRKLILLLTMLTSFSAFAQVTLNAGDRVVRNPNQDKDLYLCVDDGGTETCPVKLQGSTGGVSVALDPTIMSDIDATRLGQKTYIHGGSYNGGLAPTITLAGGGGTFSTVNFSEFIPYQMQDGTWRLKFNFEVVVSSTVRTNANFAINGITFFDTGSGSGGGQGVAGWPAHDAPTRRSFAANATNEIAIRHDSNTTSTYMASGDVRIASKPTFAF